MKPNALRAKLAAGQPVFGTMIQETRNVSIGLIMANAGCDFLFYDMEHGPYNMESVADMIRGTRLAGITPLVRVPNDEYHLMVRPLDAGAQGIMIPRMETRAQVERIVDSCMYPPQGSRGCSVNKGHNDYQPQVEWEFAEEANRENLIILQIERARAVEHIDDLISVAGVGAVLIGPNDLSLSLGNREKDQLKALEPYIQRVLDSALAHKVPCGIHIPNMDWLIEWMRRGMTLLTFSSDLHFLVQGARSGMERLKAAASSR
jgi:2-keto-3-deoxy-L-rhamnonate aldolase RhmA